jgi:putative peptide zinc metalloprotease protein
MQSTPHRPIPIARRVDLEVVEQYICGQRCVVVGDPIALEYHRLNDQEFALLNWLDGKNSAEDIKRLFEDQFAPYQIEHREIESYLIQFYQKGLVCSSGSEIGQYLLRRAQKSKTQKSLSKLKGILSIRMRGVNPESFLNWLTPKTQWFFSTGMIAFNVLLMCSAMILIAMNFQQFQSRLPSFQEFFTTKNWLAVGAVVLVTKVLHELGHGIVLTKLGGRCHELGVMFMVFMPTLYVNASGSWKFPNRWHRAAVGAAGMYVELTLAACATFFWWYSQPGVLQYTALNIMATCSVSAVVLNGNPLMKYDGYFILCDWIGIPNLQQRASSFTRDRFLKLGLGINESTETFSTDRTKQTLVAYALASYFYRFVVVYGVAFALMSTFKVAGLDLLAKSFSAFSLAILVLLPFIALFKFFQQPGQRLKVDQQKRTVLVVIGGLLGIGFFALPLPSSIVCEFVVEPRDMSTIYVRHTSPIDQVLVQPGQWVDQGQAIVQQRSIDLELESEKIAGEIAGIKHRIASIELTLQRTAEDSRERSDLRSKLTVKEASLQEIQLKLEQLTLRAQRSGRVFANWTSPTTKTDEDDLGGVTGWTIQNENQHMLLKRGEVFCRIADDAELQAKLTLDQFDVREIFLGQSVRLLVDSNSYQVQSGKVVSIADQNVDQVPLAMTVKHGGTIEPKQTSSHANDLGADQQTCAPGASTYQAIALFDERAAELPSGYRGTAKIRLPNVSAFHQLHRFLSKLFRFDL